MSSIFNIKALATVVLLSTIGIAKADSFYVLEGGSYSQTGLVITSSFLTTGTVFSSLTAPVVSGTLTVNESAPPTSAGVAATGTLVLEDAASDQLTFSFAGTVHSGFGQSLSATADLTGVSATGAYKNYISGNGDFSFTFAPGSQAQAFGQVEGTVQSVPEPASWAVLGLGIVGIAVRRSRV